jgi:hypothetical protein
MSARHVVRRGVATAGSGALVVGAGLALGVLVADMATDWSAREAGVLAGADAVAAGDAAAETAAALAAGDAVAAGDAALPPRVVTRIVERHVTPEPVVVHRRVYRTTEGSGSRRTTSAVAPRAPRTVARPSRRVVAPAPAAPRRTPVRAPASTTSASS